MTKMGRPFSDNPKDIKYSIRIDAETEAKLKAYCEENNITKGEAIRQAINLLLKKRR
jgi:predicted DNA-binding protein